MIHKIFANDSRFKSVEFQLGLNVILADKKQESGEKDSRNGLGKTTLINIIHFCLGADLNRGSLPVDKISDWVFFIEMDLFGEKITAARMISNPGIVKVTGKISQLPILAERDTSELFDFYKIEDWKILLGISLFGLNEISNSKYVPTFRNLISYFLRNGTDAYSKPFVYFRSQPSWSIQAHNAFFLGLNWEYVSFSQKIKDKSKAVTSLNQAIKTGIISSKGELEAQRIRLQLEFDNEKIALSLFKVYPQYQKIQESADLLTGKIHDLSNRNLILSRKLTQYEKSIQSERAPDDALVSQLYEEAGVHFGRALKKTLAEAKTFHSEIIQNRKNFLKVEIEHIRNQIESNNKEIDVMISNRSDSMAILKTHGAFEEFTVLQEHLLEKKERLEQIKVKINEIKEMSMRTKDIKAEKIELETKLQRDYEQSRPKWEKAVAGFSENSQALYNEPGNLIINVSESGYNFDVDIPRSNSEGVGKMKIYCYDLMLVDLFSKLGKINFLVHDSTIFDGVDSRQIAHALEHAHNKAIKEGFQYICTFNSDMIPKNNFTKDFNINKYVRLVLSDQDPKDSLMGFRY